MKCKLKVTNKFYLISIKISRTYIDEEYDIWNNVMSRLVEKYYDFMYKQTNLYNFGKRMKKYVIFKN